MGVGDVVLGDVWGKDLGGEGLLEDCREAFFEDGYRWGGVSLGDLLWRGIRGVGGTGNSLLPRFALFWSSSRFFASSDNPSSPALTQYPHDPAGTLLTHAS